MYRLRTRLTGSAGRDSVVETMPDTVLDTSPAHETATPDTQPGSDAETHVGSGDDMPSEGTVLRFGVWSDTHIGNGSLQGNMRKALEALSSFQEANLDMIMVSGDLTDTTGLNITSDKEIKSFYQTYVCLLPEIPIFYCLGSMPADSDTEADVPAMRQMFKDIIENFDHDLSPDTYAQTGVRHIVMSGYHIFAIDHMATEEALGTLVTELTALTEEDPDRETHIRSPTRSARICDTRTVCSVFTSDPVFGAYAQLGCPRGLHQSGFRIYACALRRHGLLSRGRSPSCQ